MQVDMPPPSPPVPIEPGPSMQDIDKSTQFPADEPTDSSLPKEDVERAILIECSEIHAQALSKDWEAVAALGQAMDLKHPLSEYPLKGEHTPPHVAFLLPYFIAQLILGNARGTLVRLISLESIVSQHPIFQSLNTLAYALSNQNLSGIFPAIQHLEEVVHKTHDTRYDAELKEVVLRCIRGLRDSYRRQTAQDIGRAYGVISKNRLSMLLGFSENPSALQAYTQSLQWPFDEASSTYRPHPAQLDVSPDTHLGFNDLKFLSTETAALDAPM
ncbi:hypothetical protein NliqN6_1554 [Naganishia liquefaciens]|uniref:CSN8/PSMD8/EIF3K domain-containing protein n=1 Tax=Naganishia liquefaciens TaxID=104408 RepID=A0A8H3YEE2_9TREE|nr:hypothetical protein NliqN6_1554 [Naganishia liquefaciens]